MQRTSIGFSSASLHQLGLCRSHFHLQGFHSLSERPKCHQFFHHIGAGGSIGEGDDQPIVSIAYSSQYFYQYLGRHKKCVRPHALSLCILLLTLPCGKTFPENSVPLQSGYPVSLVPSVPAALVNRNSCAPFMPQPHRGMSGRERTRAGPRSLGPSVPAALVNRNSCAPGSMPSTFPLEYDSQPMPKTAPQES